MHKRSLSAYPCAETPNEVFAYKKASLLSDDVIAEHLREKMRASLTYRKELVERMARASSASA